MLGAILAAAGIGAPVYRQRARSETSTTPATTLSKLSEHAQSATAVGSVPLLFGAVANEPYRPVSTQAVDSCKWIRWLHDGGGAVAQARRARIARRRALTTELKRLKDTFPGLELTFLIATLPDPIDSHIPLYFDSGLTAIEWALQDCKFVPDSYELPWQTWLRARTDSWTPPRDYRDRPGTLLFRGLPKNEDKDKNGTLEPHRQLLVLLVVGETPTAGIHTAALTESLDLIDAWHEVTRSKSPPAKSKSPAFCIPIIGPTFSGSSDSLRDCLVTWHRDRKSDEPTADPFDFSICTGAATDPGNKDRLKPLSDPTIHFAATVVSDDFALNNLLGFLNRRIPEQKIALLCEAGTEYGAFFRKYRQLVRLYYPMQIGRLRDEYEKSRQQTPPPTSPPSDIRPKLDFTFDRTPFAVDTLPIFSGEAALAAERQLAATLSMISRRDIRAVGIIGSDVNDVLFLSQQVRSQAPDVQLFTLGSDLLYSNPDYLRYTAGMLMASTYPLFPNNHTWCGQDNEELLPFPNSLAVGTFNATLFLMNQRGQERRPLYEYRAPFPSHAICPRAAEALKAEPPLWLTMVGHDGPWPVHTWDAAGDGYLQAESPGKIRDTKGSQGTVATFPSGVNAFVTGIVAIVCVALLFFCNPLRCWPSWVTTELDLTSELWFAPFAPLPSRVGARHGWWKKIELSHKIRRSGYRHAIVFCASLLSILLCFSGPLWALCLMGFVPEGNRGRSSYWIDLVTTALAGASLTAALVWLGWKWLVTTWWIRRDAWQNRDTGQTTRNWVILAIVFIAIGVVVLAGLTAWLWCRPYDLVQSDTPVLDTVIYADRWGTFSSGVSPIVGTSLLSGIVALWGLCHLRRLRMLTFYAIESPFGKWGEPVHDVDKNENLKRIDKWLEELLIPLKRTIYRPSELPDWLFSIAAAVGCIYLFFIRWNGTPETWIFNWFFVVSGLAAVAVIVFVQVQFMATTRSFQRWLRRLSHRPMMDALGRVPQQLATRASAAFFAVPPHPGEVEGSVRLLKQLANRVELSETSSTEPFRKKVREWSSDAEALLQAINATESQSQLRAYELGSILCSKLRQIGAVFASKLDDFWSNRPLDADAKTKSPQTIDPSGQITPPDPWQADAELFVALQVTTLIRQIFAQLRNLVTFLVVMVLMLLWAFNSYPFQPHRLIAVFSYALVLWVVGSVLIAVLKFNRDEVLSHLAGTTPNRLTLDRTVIVPVITYVVIPLISLAAAQFPEVSDSLFSWIGFIQRALHG